MLGSGDRDSFELGLIGWCLKSGDEFDYLIHQIRTKHFSDVYAQNVWPYLLDAFERNGQWPTEGEAVFLLQQRRRTDPLLPLLLDYTKQCYRIEITPVTSEEIRRWVTTRELLELSGNLQQFTQGVSSKSTDELMQGYTDLRLQFEQAMIVAEGDDDESEDFDPLSDYALDNLDTDIEEDYGSEPLPTGFVRLDAKLRDGGVRPHGVLILGPTGGGKTVFVFNICMYNVSRGLRGVYISFDDARAELRERQTGFMLCEEIEFSAAKAEGRLPEIKQEMRRIRDEEYPGKLIFKVLDPEQYTPMDLIRKLEKLVRKLAAEDKRDGRPEETWGKLDFVAIDTGDQVRAESKYKSEWYEVGKMHQALNIIPKRFRCPMFVVVQGGQQTVGAAQLTERDIGEGYAKAKPYKLILGVAQTAYQYQTDLMVSVTDSLVRDNLHHLHNFCIDRDRYTKWKPFSLCVIKNTRGRSKQGAANRVKIPMLVNYGSCRIIENFNDVESALTSPLQTQRDEIAATAPTGTPVNRRRQMKGASN